MAEGEGLGSSPTASSQMVPNQIAALVPSLDPAEDDL